MPRSPVPRSAMSRSPSTPPAPSSPAGEQPRPGQGHAPGAAGPRYGGLLARVAVVTPPLHPTQLYEALCELCIALFLLLLARRKRRHGQVVLAYGALYAASRFCIELFRADPDRHYLLRVATPGLSRLLHLPPAAPTLLSGAWPIQ